MRAIESTLFKQWFKNIQTERGLLSNGSMSLRQVIIQGVDMFGNCVGFLKFKAEVIDKETRSKFLCASHRSGARLALRLAPQAMEARTALARLSPLTTMIPGIVFARGPAVAVLILLESDGETYAVLTEQVRVPVGKLIVELPAGMLDDDKGDIVGTAVREVEEETGLHLNLDDLVDLTAFLHPSTGCKVFPSPGGCDEEISLLLYRGSVDKGIIKQLQERETGIRDHGELIRVHIIPYRDLWRMTPDAKVLTAIALYEMAMRDGLLPLRKD
ncbi:Nudix hydrolase 14, chloroplastic [Orobanche gracilis]